LREQKEYMEYMDSSDLEIPVLENDVNSSVANFLTMYALQYHVAIQFKRDHLLELYYDTMG
jgi:hypothetical protein